MTLPETRRRQPCAALVLGVLACLSILVVIAQAQQAAPAMDAGLSAFMRMIPLGAESRGAVIPSFDEAGGRTSLITADVVRRIDDERLYAEGLVIEMFNAGSGNDIRLDLQSAFYHLAASMLRSTQRSRVSRSDFEIEGDNLIFDTAKNQGVMSGNIRMVIFDTGALSGELPAHQESQPAK